MSKVTILPAATTTVTGDSFEALNDGLGIFPNQTYQATVTGTGAVTATVIIEFSNDGTNWLTGATISLSGTTSASDGFVSSASWVYRRARVTAISGTSAAVVVTMGV